MNVKKIHINSFLLLALFSFINYVQIKHFIFFYVSYFLFSLSLFITFINIRFIFISLKNSDKPIIFIPSIVFHFLLIITWEYYIFIKKIYLFDRMFLVYIFASLLFLFTLYNLINKILKKSKFYNEQI